MLPPRMRRRWALLVPLALLTGAAEAGAAAGIFALISALSDPQTGLALPWVVAIVPLLPLRGPNAVILQLTGMLAAYSIAKSLLLLRVQYLRHRVAHDSSAHLACEMLRRYLSAPYPFHFRRNSADLIRNCTSSVENVLGGVVGASVSIVTEVLIAAGLVVAVVATSPAVSVVAAVALMLIMLVVLRLTRRAAWRHGSQSHELAAAMLKSVQQALGGIKEVKVLGREQYFYDDFAARQRELLLLGYLGITLGNAPAVAIQTVLLCGALAFVAILTGLGETGLQTLPVTAVFGYAGLRIVPMVSAVGVHLNTIRGSQRAVDELYEDFLTVGGDGPLAVASQEDVKFGHAIVLDRVSYAYPGTDRFALREISLSIRRGESTGIIGPTGAGKSTLVDLVLGLLPPTQGRITVDGVDLRGTAAAPWRRRVGYVPQTPFLIDDSLRRNIALGIPDRAIDDSRVRAVLRMAQLETFLGELPDGLNTHVGERGVRLSGGERQRVAIARALYHDPDLIVFDEATSSLDLGTEAEVTHTIDSLRGSKTIVVIAHRLSAVKDCDRLVWLANGAVVDQGSFDDLIAHSQEFRELVALSSI